MSEGPGTTPAAAAGARKPARAIRQRSLGVAAISSSGSSPSRTADTRASKPQSPRVRSPTAPTMSLHDTRRVSDHQRMTPTTTRPTTRTTMSRPRVPPAPSEEHLRRRSCPCVLDDEPPHEERHGVERGMCPDRCGDVASPKPKPAKDDAGKRRHDDLRGHTANPHS